MFGRQSGYDLLANVPRLGVEGHAFVARTSWINMLITLGLWGRTVRLDPDTRALQITDRVLWLIPIRRTVRLADIDEVLYRYRDLTDILPMMHARDAIDCYTVGIRQTNGNDIILFHFLGEGEFTNDTLWPDIFYWWEFTFDVQGSQKRHSLRFYELLRGAVARARTPPPGAPNRHVAGRLRG